MQIVYIESVQLVKHFPREYKTICVCYIAHCRNQETALELCFGYNEHNKGFVVMVIY